MIHNTCNMAIRDLPDMYAQSPRAEGIHIRQILHGHVTTITYSSLQAENALISLLAFGCQ